MTSEKKWRIVYTRPGCELKVAELLSRKNIENYCPLHKKMHQPATRTRAALQPLFNGCVFVRIQDLEQRTVKETKGIINFLFWMDQPALIRDEEVQAIRFFLAEHTSIQLEKIKVHAGTLGLNNCVTLSLPSLHYVLVAETRTVVPIPVYEPTALYESNLYGLKPGIL